MTPTSQMCRCGAAIVIHPDGRRVECYTGRPHLDHNAYEPWMDRHGFTAGWLGWLYEVVNFPRSIRDQIVSPRLLHAVGLTPGIDWDQYGPTGGQLITTPGQQPHYSGYEGMLDENDPETTPERPVGAAETPQKGPEAPVPTPNSPEGVHQPETARRFGAEDEERTPGRTAAGRWGR